MSKHDQLFKNLLEAFLPDLLAMMLPHLARDLEAGKPSFLRTEHFTDLPEGARRQVDLLAQVQLRTSFTRKLLIHVEIERHWSAAMARRLWHYHLAIRLRHRRPVISLVIYLRGGDGGIHRNTWQEELPPELRVPTPVTFTYHSFALAGCEAKEYLERPEPLAWALAALMRSDLEPERHKLECMCRILHAPVNRARRYLLVHCIETYLPLDSEQERSFRAMLIEREGPDALDIYHTELDWVEELKRETLEEGLQEGMEKGRIEGMRRLVAGQLEQRFGPLPEAVLSRVSRMSSQRLFHLSRQLLTATSLENLGLV